MTRKHLGLSLLLLGITVSILLTMGRLAFCKCGTVALWSGDVMSNMQSQQLFDPYTFTHIIHGFLIYAVLWLTTRKHLNPAQRFVIAVGIEGLWEIIENTDFVINRYREATISLDYYGDSILNSIGDVIAMATGFWLAWKLPVKSGVLTAITLDLALLYAIHDNLAINIIMLIHPIEAIKTWQSQK